jgi:hypothetical protein
MDGWIPKDLARSMTLTEQPAIGMRTKTQPHMLSNSWEEPVSLSDVYGAYTRTGKAHLGSLVSSNGQALLEDRIRTPTIE